MMLSLKYRVIGKFQIMYSCRILTHSITIHTLFDFDCELLVASSISL